MTKDETELERFVLEYADSHSCPRLDDDLFGRYGIVGEDAFDFMEAFAKRFTVDMTGYLWYFHHEEEGHGIANIGGYIFKPPYHRVKPIPITLSVLEQAVRLRHWPMDYPPHTLPSRRWDLLINQAIQYGLGACLIVAIILKLA